MIHLIYKRISFFVVAFIEAFHPEELLSCAPKHQQFVFPQQYALLDSRLVIQFSACNNYKHIEVPR
jgi:hypothetical protein